MLRSLHISDFGTAKVFDTESFVASTFAGTITYMAPEVASETKGSKYDPFRSDGM